MLSFNGPERSLEKEAQAALDRWKKHKEKFHEYDAQSIALCAGELERYLTDYIKYHREAKQENRAIEKRREDHWDMLNKKCSEDPMFQDLWNQILLLLKLEDDNLK